MNLIPNLTFKHAEENAEQRATAWFTRILVMWLTKLTNQPIQYWQQCMERMKGCAVKRPARTDCKVEITSTRRVNKV
jgi:putative alpha-1,2-mannosidase